MPSGEPQPDESWDEHYADERDAAFLYRELAKVEGDSTAAISSSGSPSSRTVTWRGG